MDKEDIKNLVRRVQGNLRITKVVATRSIKGKSGDHFAGFAAAYNSVQEEPVGMGKDLMEVMPSDGMAAQGMTLKEAKIAFYLVAMHADIAAHEAALANGGTSAAACRDAVGMIRGNYSKLIQLACTDESEPDGKK